MYPVPQIDSNEVSAKLEKVFHSCCDNEWRITPRINSHKTRFSLETDYIHPTRYNNSTLGGALKWIRKLQALSVDELSY